MKRKEFIKAIGLGSLGISVIPNVFSTNLSDKTNEETCRLQWNTLCGNIGEVYKTDAFKYVHPQKQKPNVLIYGDSISILYTSEARKQLADKATVFRLFKNGGSSHDFIPNMNTLQETMFQPNLKEGWDFNWDIIHFNVGLHDLKYLKGRNLNKDGVQVSSIETYKLNLTNSCNYLKINFPKTKLIFATTTPVPANAKGRFEGDSIRYNKAALEVLANYPDIVINDLYTFTKPHLEAWAQEPGNVHYKDVGFLAHGKEVARIISEQL
ncbi:SGNH/GDSL hydrolase family protein [uncultured Formosa sp.]|uniref:SGNH/GDSL hydrolase family protein n=1 Tax=uncultured Formosa sp. TaxID=255435 RepID=UPI002626BAC1|nr:SGNH/GDSL hydrolase family protein [uncultured Formosa sp.]